MMNIKLFSSDDKVFMVDPCIAKQSARIRTIIEDLKIDENFEEISVYLYDIDSNVLGKILKWLVYQENYLEEESFPHILLNDICWHMNFFDVEQKFLLEIAKASFKLDIEQLKNVVCFCFFKKFIEGKSALEIERAFGFENGIENDCSSASVKFLFDWCDEN